VGVETIGTDIRDPLEIAPHNGKLGQVLDTRLGFITLPITDIPYIQGTGI
jgi:hypothetical protein